MKKLVILISLIGTAVLLAFGQANPSAPAADAKKGQQLYTKYGCYQCHGREGHGGGPAGPRLGPKPIEFSLFVAYCRKPAADMPPYTAKVVSDQELADIYAFLQSRPQPPAASSIPLLK